MISLIVRISPVAGVLDLAMFSYSDFFAFFDRTLCQEEILPGWEVVAGLAFLQEGRQNCDARNENINQNCKYYLILTKFETKMALG